MPTDEELKLEKENAQRRTDKVKIFNKKVDEFNKKYGVDLDSDKFSDYASFATTGVINTDLGVKLMQVSNCRKAYRQLAQKITNDPNKLINNPEMVNEFEELFIESIYYCTDSYELNRLGDFSYIPNYEISKNDNDEYISNIDIPLVNSAGLDPKKMRASLNKSMLEAMPYVNGLADVNPTNLARRVELMDNGLEDDPIRRGKIIGIDENGNNKEYDAKVLPIIFDGGYTQEEKKNIFFKCLTDEYSNENPEFSNNLKRVNAYKQELEANGNYKGAYLLNRAQAAVNNALEGVTRENATSEKMKEIMSRCAVSLQAMINKRNNRGFFDVLFHPFRAHNETVEINNMINRISNATGVSAENIKNAVRENAYSDVPAVSQYKDAVNFATRTNDKGLDYVNGKFKTLEDNFKYQHMSQTEKMYHDNPELAENKKKIDELIKNQEALVEKQNNLEKEVNLQKELISKLERDSNPQEDNEEFVEEEIDTKKKEIVDEEINEKVLEE